MILVGHQPEYLPYLGFFQKVARAHCFMFVDSVQYAKRDFQNRNYIRDKNGKILLTVPVESKDHFSKKINEIKIIQSNPWQRKHWKSIFLSYKDTPYFKDFSLELKKIYDRNWERLVDLNVELILLFFKFLEIDVEISFSSQFSITSTKSQFIVDICKAVGANTYISGIGAKDYLDINLLRENGIKHYFCNFMHPEYPQIYSPFIPNLSIIDLIFNCGKNSRYYLDLAIKNSPLEE